MLISSFKICKNSEREILVLVFVSFTVTILVNPETVTLPFSVFLLAREFFRKGDPGSALTQQLPCSYRCTLSSGSDESHCQVFWNSPFPSLTHRMKSESALVTRYTFPPEMVCSFPMNSSEMLSGSKVESGNPTSIK